MSTNTSRVQLVAWAVWVVVALLALDVVDLTLYGIVVPLSALLMLTVPALRPQRSRSVDRRDLVAVAVLYVAVVLLFRLAFTVFTQDNTAGLFLCFAAGLLVGSVGAVVYTVWLRHRTLADLGITTSDLRVTVALGLLFAAVQFALTLWGYDLPAPVDWVPLLAMALVVGMFESVFFRGFVQNRLEASFGTPAGVAAAAVLYGLYHVGYGMVGGELVFLTGLGVVYAVAFGLTRNLLVLWPLLTPLGSFYNNVESGDIELPWASIMGFVDVAAVMLVVVWLAHRRQRRDARTQEAEVQPGATRAVADPTSPLRT